MKSYLLIVIAAIALIHFTGCKKESFDPTTKSRLDFIGTWKGTVSTFKNNTYVKEYGTVVIYSAAGGSSLSGIIFMGETSVFTEFQFVEGTLYFNVINNDPDNPNCQNWSLGGFAVFETENELEIHITGNECGPFGNEFVNWIGALNPAQVADDSVKYFNFGANGNSWTYLVTLLNGDSCQVQKQIGEVPSDYTYSGFSTQTCGWAGGNMTFRWIVSPSEFSIVIDSTLCEKSFTFPINAKPGVVYRRVVNSDTTTVTLLDTNFVLPTPAGTFTCFRYRYTEPVYAGVTKTTRTSYLWLNNKYGVVKHEVLNPLEADDILVQVLTAKNF